MTREKQYQMLSSKARKGIDAALSNEYQRRRSQLSAEEANRKGNYDATREHLNFEILRGGIIQPVDKTRTIPQRMADNLAIRGIADPNAHLAKPYYRTIADFVISGSHERMREIAFGQQDVDYGENADNSHLTRSKDIERWAMDMYRFLADEYGEDNIVSFVVHLDEKTPHCHAQVLPLDKSYKLFRKKAILTKSAFASMALYWGSLSDFSDTVYYCTARDTP